MRKVLAVIGIAALTACANLNDPTTVIVSVESGYAAALTAESAYLSSGHADPKVVKELANARNGVSGVLDPIAAAAAKGQAPSNDQVLAAQTALAAFQNALKANGLVAEGGN